VPRTPTLERAQVLRRADWLSRALADVAGVPTVRQEAERVWLVFHHWQPASRFQRALLAENISAERRGSGVALQVAPWFTVADLRSLALAATKVAHYLSD
jgi:hypothetical protein